MPSIVFTHRSQKRICVWDAVRKEVHQHAEDHEQTPGHPILHVSCVEHLFKALALFSSSSCPVNDMGLYEKGGV